MILCACKNRCGLAADDERHGSASTYRTHKCRCEPCRTAEAERNRAYREANRERVAERNRAYHEANRERRAERRRAHYIANRQAYFDRVAARRARKRNAAVGTVRRAEVFERDWGLCWICLEKADPGDWHLEHIIPLARGGAHAMDNVAVSHPACNLRKGTKLLDELEVEVA